MTLNFNQHPMKTSCWFDLCRNLALGCAVFLGGSQAWAVLGQLPGAASVPIVPPPGLAASAAVGKKVQASQPAGQASLYETHVTQLETGTVVQEYAAASGVVFAVTWSGPVLPDLRVVLGSYFPIFSSEAAQARADGRRGSPLAVNREGLVVNSGGRMRAFFGSAYAPSLVPPGVDIQYVLQ